MGPFCWTLSYVKFLYVIYSKMVNLAAKSQVLLLGEHSETLSPSGKDPSPPLYFIRSLPLPSMQEYFAPHPVTSDLVVYSETTKTDLNVSHKHIPQSRTGFQASPLWSSFTTLLSTFSNWTPKLLSKLLPLCPLQLLVCDQEILYKVSMYLVVKLHFSEFPLL